MAKLVLPAIVGFFDDPDSLMEAAAECSGNGWRNLDAYTPYPVHGLEEVMGIRRSWIPKVALGALFTGATLGFLLQYWTHSIDWPINVGGKPYNAWPAYVPVTFESAVLVAGLTTFACIFISCRLFPNPFVKTLCEEITNDRFALVVPTKKIANDDEVVKLLQRMGADEIRKLH
ncbi:DUF3341 domain-containing protein [bacterium]|nr:DUF3341 domain-containing protein [bacterium]